MKGHPRRRHWALAACVVLIVVLVVGVRVSEHGSVPTTSVPTTSVATSTSTTSTSTTVAPTTTTTQPRTPIPDLSLGDMGARVLALQDRLSALGYWLGAPDGVFGDSTQQAVYALQKAASITADGVVGPVTWRALNRGVVPSARSTTGRVVEVDLADDLLLLVNDGRVTNVLNTSTGGGYTYVDDGVTAIAETPQGIFHVSREVDGWVIDSLGALWRPKFFDAGFAIHGDSYVPSVPVSHGCVRVSDEAINWIWATNQIPLGTEVWVYD